MNTYMIPREATDENRFLFFTKDAAIFTLVGFIIGVAFIFLFNFICDMFNITWIKYIGWGICVLLCLIGYVLGTFNIPESNAFDILKKTGGESVYTILKRIIKFNKNKKIYIYERS